MIWTYLRAQCSGGLNATSSRLSPLARSTEGGSSKLWRRKELRASPRTYIKE